MPFPMFELPAAYQATSRELRSAARRPSRAVVAVLLLGALSLVLYLLLLPGVRDVKPAVPSYADQVFSWVQPLARWRPERTERHEVAVGPFVGLLVGLFALYGAGLRATGGRSSGRLELAVFGTGATFLVAQLFGAATLSHDVYSYIVYGRIQALYDTNPYLVPPSDFRDDPFWKLVTWRDTTSVYGPLWTLLSAGLAWLGGDRLGLTVLLFRASAVLAGLAAAGLVWVCLRRTAPERAAQGLLFFLWNPLVVIETGLSGHNDTLMMAFVLLGLYLHLRGWPAVAVAAFTLSVLVKYISGLLLPLYVLFVLRGLPSWRSRLRFVAASGVAALAVTAFSLGAAGVGLEVLPVGSGSPVADRYTNSLHELAFAALRLELGDQPEAVNGPWARPERRAQKNGSSESDDVAGDSAGEGDRGWRAAQANTWLRGVTWTAFGLVWLLAAWRATGFRALVTWSTIVFLASYWLLGSWIWPWYVVWAVALAALVPGSWPAVLAATLSATVLTLYASAGFESGRLWWIDAYRSLPAWLLPLLLVGAMATFFSASRRERGLSSASWWPTYRTTSTGSNQA